MSGANELVPSTSVSWRETGFIKPTIHQNTGFLSDHPEETGCDSHSRTHFTSDTVGGGSEPAEGRECLLYAPLLAALDPPISGVDVFVPPAISGIQGVT